MWLQCKALEVVFLPGMHGFQLLNRLLHEQQAFITVGLGSGKPCAHPGYGANYARGYSLVFLQSYVFLPWLKVLE